MIVCGQVAQSVEQVTENHWVGGSIPPLATSLFFLVSSFALAGCGDDPCEKLCDKLKTKLNKCVNEWPIEWSELGADNASSFKASCENLWGVQRSNLEFRVLEDAYDQCDEALKTLTNDRQSCETLRALYLADPNL